MPTMVSVPKRSQEPTTVSAKSTNTTTTSPYRRGKLEGRRNRSFLGSLILYGPSPFSWTAGGLGSSPVGAGRLCDMVNDLFLSQHTFGGSEVVANVILRPDPLQIPFDAGRKVHRRFVASGAGAGDIGGQVAHLAGSELSAGYGLDGYIEGSGDHRGHLPDLGRPAAPDVYRQAIELVTGGG